MDEKMSAFDPFAWDLIVFGSDPTLPIHHFLSVHIADASQLTLGL
jgi:hypothetical protein